MSKRTPTYCLHKASGQAVVRIDGKDHYLGKHGPPESRADYNRLIAEWFAGGQQLPTAAASTDASSMLSVNELVTAFWKHAEQHYRHPDGRPTDEIHCLRAALRPLRKLYGFTPVKDFGPLALKAVRQKMIDSVDARTGRPWCRRTINLHTYRIRSVFRWGVEQELVPAGILHALQAVRGLQKGRSAARETGKVKPVPEAWVMATLPRVAPPVRAMIELQLLTGMRPGEVVIMRAVDLETSGKIWLYRPGSDQDEHGTHKTAWHGHERVIALGPRAQEIVKRFLQPNLHAYLLAPEATLAHCHAERAKNRTTPARQQKRKPRPKRFLSDRYTVDAYRIAVARGCDRAFPPPEHLRPSLKPDGKRETRDEFLARLTPTERAELREWQQAHRWHPHQLRHTKATEIRREAGLDAARAVLGHKSSNITEVYAEIDMGKAAAVMEKLG